MRYLPILENASKGNVYSMLRILKKELTQRSRLALSELTFISEYKPKDDF